MDEVFERASKRRSQLQDARRKLRTQLEEVDAELKELDGFFNVAARFGGKEPSSLREAPVKSSAFVGPRQWPEVHPAQPWPGDKGSSLSNMIAGAHAVPHGSKTRLIVHLARDIVKAHGALPARRILELLDQIGAGETLIPGRDIKGRISYLSAVLSKDERFKSDRDAGGYMLAEEETPRAEGQEGPKDSQQDFLK